MAPVDGALRLTLVTLLLQPVGDWRVRPFALVLAAGGLVLPGLLRNAWLWGALATLAGVRVVLDWPMADNHAYLLCWWCLACAIAVSGGAGDEAHVLGLNARLLLGLVFACATLWKVALAPDFLDTRFFRVTLLTDPRFERAATVLAGLGPEQRAALGSFVSMHVDGPAPDAEPPRQPARLRLVATVATVWTAALEAALAVAFLSPPGWPVSRCRDAILLLFALTTYPVAPVEGFGWLLLAQGYAQADETRSWARRGYLIAFAALIVSRAGGTP